MLSDIIHDFEYHSIGPPLPPSNPSALADAAPFDARTTARFTKFLDSPQPPQPRLYRLTFLGVLSTSKSFMEVFTNERDGLWKALLMQLDTHMAVINFYARSHQVPWHEALINYFDKIGDAGEDSAPFRTAVWPADVPTHPLGLDDNIFQGEHPHVFYLRLNGRKGRNRVASGSRKDQMIINIAESVYDERSWPKAAPPTWPANRKYVDHLQNVRNATIGIPANQADDFLRCGSCNKTLLISPAPI